MVEAALGDEDEPVGRRVVGELVDQPGGDVVLAEHLDHPLRRAVALGDE